MCKAGDCGVQAADALAGLVRGREISCRLDGRNGEGFVQGICEAAGADLNRALVAAGWARAEGKSEALALAEQQARMARLGLWGSAGGL
jgi:endonuclease YncB( thermonuclease family)